MLSEVAERNETCIKLAQENSQHLVTLPLVSLPNDAWETSAEDILL